MVTPNKYLHRNYIAIACLLTGFGWIAAGDIIAINFLETFFPPSQIQLFKGFMFIAIATTGLYGLLYLRDRKIHHSQKYADTILETANVGIGVANKNGTIIRANKAYANLLNYPKEELIGKSITDIIPKEDHTDAQKVVEEIFTSSSEYSGEWTLIDKKNQEIQVVINASTLTETTGEQVLVASVTDISDQKKQEQQLKESLKEKEILLTEIHHRVKNNLAVVSGMMQLQAFDTDNEEVSIKLSDCVARIKTMATIHELLYKSNNFAQLELDNNLKELTTNIVDTFQTGDKFRFHFDIEPVILNINQAIPCLLVVNEVITNIIKHGYEDGDQGQISLVLTEANNTINLKISDDGKGLPGDFESKLREGTVGLHLIDSLVQQLEGSYEYKSPKKGAIFKLSFPKSNMKGIGASKLT